MARGRLVAAVVCIALAAQGGGAVAAGPRQVGTGVTFGTGSPKSVTGVDFQIHWQDPNDPQNGKPHSVTQVVLHYAPGTRIDTSVPVHCTASDAEIMAQGASACPAASRLGGGLLTTDNGSPGQTRYVLNTVTVFSNGADLIFLLETQDPPTRLVAHSKVQGSTVTTDVPPTPGLPPPDPSNALRDETLHFPPYVRHGKPYTTTPATCPRSGHWTNTLVIAYQDGVTQRLASRSPCRRPATPARLSLTGVPRGCTSHDFVAHVRTFGVPGPRRSRLRLDGRVIRRTPRRIYNETVPASRLRSGRHRLVATVRSAAGLRLRRTRSFRRC
jgi:hypothetical protein